MSLHHELWGTLAIFSSKQSPTSFNFFGFYLFSRALNMSRKLPLGHANICSGAKSANSSP